MMEESSLRIGLCGVLELQNCHGRVGIEILRTECSLAVYTNRRKIATMSQIALDGIVHNL